MSKETENTDGIKAAETDESSRSYSRWHPTEERRLVQLRLQDNLPFQEIAELLGRSERAVKLRFAMIVDSIDWSEEDEVHWPGISNHDSNHDKTLREIANLVKEGATPRDIALEYPEIFLKYADSIIILYQTLNRKRWRGYE